MGTVAITELTTEQQNVTAAQFNALVVPLLNEFNGSIDNSNIKAAAAIAYTKLSLGGNLLNSDINASAAIAYSKLAALTDGNILVGNVSNVAVSVTPSGDVSMTNAGATTVTDLTITNEADGDLLQFDGTNWVRVAKGSAGQLLESDGTDVLWGAGAASILDYGTSASSSTGKTLPALHVCYGTVTVGANSSQAITNLPFTSATSYATTCTFKATGSSEIDGPFATNNSGAQTTIYSADGSERDLYWIAIGT